MRACGVKFGRVGAFRSALTAKPQRLPSRREFQPPEKKVGESRVGGFQHVFAFFGSFESSSTLRQCSSANVRTCSSRQQCWG